MKKIIEPPAASVQADTINTNKRGYADHWSFSLRKCDQLLARGLPHFKISARQVRINIAEADAWMREQFHTQRRAQPGNAKE